MVYEVKFLMQISSTKNLCQIFIIRISVTVRISMFNVNGYRTGLPIISPSYIICIKQVTKYLFCGWQPLTTAEHYCCLGTSAASHFDRQSLVFRQDYHIGTAGKMSVDIDATPDLLLLCTSCSPPPKWPILCRVGR